MVGGVIETSGEILTLIPHDTADLVVDEVRSLSKIPDFFKKSGICLCTSLT